MGMSISGGVGLVPLQRSASRPIKEIDRRSTVDQTQAQ